jgi:hypothetical protein
LTWTNFPITDLLHILGGDANPPLYFLLLKAMPQLTNDFAILKVFSANHILISMLTFILNLRIFI